MIFAVILLSSLALALSVATAVYVIATDDVAKERDRKPSVRVPRGLE